MVVGFKSIKIITEMFTRKPMPVFDHMHIINIHYFANVWCNINGDNLSKRRSDIHISEYQKNDSRSQ